jgi:predicted anti-sigma-YlaC factor YlaD
MLGCAQNNECHCPTEEIAAYIDGELDSMREDEVEAHLAVCEMCSRELNRQKQFLWDVTSELRRVDTIDLPPDFAKKIAVNAESTVNGLRRPHERFNAIFICVALAFFALFALGTEAANLLSLAFGLIEKAKAVALFFGQLLYSFFLGIAIVLRTFITPAVYEATVVIAVTILCIAVALCFRRRVKRLLRV